MEKRLLTAECERLRDAAEKFEREQKEYEELLLREQQEREKQLLQRKAEQERKELLMKQEEAAHREQFTRQRREAERSREKSRIALGAAVVLLIIPAIFFPFKKYIIAPLFVSLETIFVLLTVACFVVSYIEHKRYQIARHLQYKKMPEESRMQQAQNEDGGYTAEAGEEQGVLSDAAGQGERSGSTGDAAEQEQGSDSTGYAAEQAKRRESLRHATEYAEKMLTDLKDSLQEKETGLFNIAEEINAKRAKSESERRREEDILALDMAAQEIQRISKAYYEDMKDGLNAEISRLVSVFTAGAYDSVRLDDKGKLQIFTEGREVEPQALSRGTLEQIYLALRLAVGNVVSHEEKLPILFDDAFALYDEERLAYTLKTLSGLGNQIIIFTCQDREERLLYQLKIPYRKTVL